jgi:hypothetical protein
VAEASEKAARTEADAQQAAARTYQHAYQSDPNLYETLRSLDTISQLVSHTTNLILPADAAPFKILIDGPPGVKNTGTNAASTADPTSPAADSTAATKTTSPAKVSAPQKAPVPRKDGTIPEVAGRQ